MDSRVVGSSFLLIGVWRGRCWRMRVVRTCEGGLSLSEAAVSRRPAAVLRAICRSIFVRGSG